MKNQNIIRFAPSPNGFLHLGHAYSALLCFDFAKKLNARFLLRIEDIDITRSKNKYIEAIYDDLKWLNLEWEKPVLLQSQNFLTYQKAAKQLKEMQLLYPCFCTRKEIAKTSKTKDPDGAPIYSGRCKSLTKSQINENLMIKTPVQWRLDMNKAILQTGELNYSAMQVNPAKQPKKQTINPIKWGDVIITRKDFPTSYHLSVVVDDAAQNISHIIRGKDLEKATDIHVLLQKLLGLPTPKYFHHDLILDDEKNKLSKSKGSTSIRDLRKSGILVSEIHKRFGF